MVHLALRLWLLSACLLRLLDAQLGVLSVHIFSTAAVDRGGFLSEAALAGALQDAYAAYTSAATAPRVLGALKISVHVAERSLDRSWRGLASLRERGVAVLPNTRGLAPAALVLDALAFAGCKDPAVCVPEYMLVLDADVAMSPLALSYVAAVVGKYHDKQMKEQAEAEGLLGVSLHPAGPLSEVTGRALPPSPTIDVLLGYQCPDTYGAVYLGRQMHAFALWAAQLHADPLTPYSLANRWAPGLHWRKHLLRWMVASGKFLLFPALPAVGGGRGSDSRESTQQQQRAFVTPSPTLAAGAEQGQQQRRRRQHLVNRKAAGYVLVVRAEVVSRLARRLSPLESVRVLDYLGQDVTMTMTMTTIGEGGKGTGGLITQRLAKDAAAFDRCTMVLTVYDRHAHIKQRLAHYQHFAPLASILVVWNYLNATPVHIAENEFKVPVHVLAQRRNSMNNRFFPWPQVSTPCVLNMDDDWDMPLDHLAYAVDLWRKQFFAQLVGFRHQGRAHFIGEDGLYHYSTNQSRGVSMVLPSGFVYDRQFMHLYTYRLGALGLLAYVDSVTNCDDILFNFLVANHTGTGPVVVNMFARALQMGISGGLWTRGAHMPVRDACMNLFARVFSSSGSGASSGMPLQFSGLRVGVTRSLELRRSGGECDVPRLDDMWWSRQPLPHLSPSN